MIDALIQGTLYKVPQARTASNGRRFATANVRTPTKDGTAIFVSVVTFSATACQALLALEDGDAVALAGELTPKIYTPRDGGEPRPSIDLLAHRVLTEYHVARKRKAVAEAKALEHPTPTPAATETAPAEFDDPIPF